MTFEIDEEDYIEHYGTPRHSGRYPWGSGADGALSNNMSFYDHVQSLRRDGLKDTDIAEGLGMKTTQLRARMSIAKNEQRQSQIAMAERLREKGYSNGAIAERMGLPGESSVRALLAPGVKDRADVLQTTASMLRDQVAEKTYLDVGAGVEYSLGISQTRLNTALAVLQEEGYGLHKINVMQLGTGHETQMKVLIPPGVTYKELYANRDNIKGVQTFSEDGGRSWITFQPPVKINPDRVGVNWKEDGGAEADGVIYVRPGVKDVSLGASSYAQVRISVGDGHYLKGMAMYKDDLPVGIDLQFNTNKARTANKLDAMKSVSDDPDNPYGASIKRQIIERGPDGKERVTSAMNIVHEEGDWSSWSKTVSTQMLSKQPTKLAKEQLDMTYEKRLKDFDELSSLTNRTVRRQLLEKFGDETDAAAVDLDAAGFKRQGWHAILPVKSLPPTDVYAPNFKNGERVVLIRYPHAGTFEIPELTVNNRHPESSKLLKGAKDAIGIHPNVAERLSGADFDGDTVLVIPNNSGKVKSSAALEGLKDFDPRSQYKAYEGMPRMTPKQKGLEMGKVSNLITDMTIQKASTSELARAVKHSMVVIDAEKHNLNYKQSALDNNIKQLEAKYQARPGQRQDGGASTLISRATSQTMVPDRKARSAAEGGGIDKETGKRVFVETGKTHWATGKALQTQSKKLQETDDAHTLSSGTPMERLYADHSNRLKVLANLARKESVNTPNSIYSPTANKAYKAESDSLSSKLAIAKRNAPLERQAQVLANSMVRTKMQANPNLDAATLKKVKYQALQEARARTGAKKILVEITDREWEAIQAGAVSDSRLSQILANADIDRVRALATPRTQVLMTSTKTARAKSMLASGYTRAEVASALGVSLTTLDVGVTGQGGDE